jgi:DNA-binding transcriptional MerR regulator
MKTYTISKLARAFGLSRSTLLYYDRIGLLPSSGRTSSGYRCYTDDDRRRLERICSYRLAGLSLAEIQAVISSDGEPSVAVLEKRLRDIGDQILEMKRKQRLLASMLKGMASGGCPAAVDKEMWVSMLRAAGLDESAMERWHTEFELRAPEAHHEFLLSLGIPEREAVQIREWSAGQGRKSPSGPL